MNEQDSFMPNSLLLPALTDEKFWELFAAEFDGPKGSSQEHSHTNVVSAAGDGVLAPAEVHPNQVVLSEQPQPTAESDASQDPQDFSEFDSSAISSLLLDPAFTRSFDQATANLANNNVFATALPAYEPPSHSSVIHSTLRGSYQIPHAIARPVREVGVMLSNSPQSDSEPTRRFITSQAQACLSAVMDLVATLADPEQQARLALWLRQQTSSIIKASSSSPSGTKLLCDVSVTACSGQTVPTVSTISWFPSSSSANIHQISAHNPRFLYMQSHATRMRGSVCPVR